MSSSLGTSASRGPPPDKVPEAEGTPGPWAVDENRLAGYGDNGNNFHVVAPGHDGRNPLATLSFCRRILDDGKNDAYFRARADAHLIAAAPELLKALKDYIRGADRGRVSWGVDRAARAAIAKATAQPPSQGS